MSEQENSQVNFELRASGSYANTKGSVPGEWVNNWWAIELENPINFRAGEQLTEAMQESIAEQLGLPHEYRSSGPGSGYVNAPTFWPDVLGDGKDLLIEQDHGLDV